MSRQARECRFGRNR